MWISAFHKTRRLHLQCADSSVHLWTEDWHLLANNLKPICESQTGYESYSKEEGRKKTFLLLGFSGWSGWALLRACSVGMNFCLSQWWGTRPILKSAACGVRTANCLKESDSGSKRRKLKKDCWMWAIIKDLNKKGQWPVKIVSLFVLTLFRISANILIHFSRSLDYLHKFSWRRPQFLKHSKEQVTVMSILTGLPHLFLLMSSYPARLTQYKGRTEKALLLWESYCQWWCYIVNCCHFLCARFLGTLLPLCAIKETSSHLVQSVCKVHCCNKCHSTGILTGCCPTALLVYSH